MMEIPRIIVHDHCCEPLFDLRPDLLVSATRTDEINGEHCLSIITAQRLQQGQRLVYRDAMGLWWEYVVLGVDELHDSGAMALGTYYAVWSPQYDLSTVYAEDIEVGGEFDASAHVAMTHALDGTSRWEVGSVDSLGELTMEMFGNSAWERVVDVTNNYGGELGWSMSYDTLTGRVKSRKLNLVSQLGSANAVRRFDWGYDITSIRRKPQEVPNCCRIIPVGTNDDVTLDGFVIEGKLEQRYLEDEDAAKAFRYPDGKGGYEYPTRKVKLSIDNDTELLEYAKKHLHDYTRPTPTYEASVIQFAEAGMDVKGVTLGDVVHIVDRGFNPDEPLLLEGRVVKVVQNLIDQTDVKLTIGQIGNGFSTMYRQMQADMKSMRNNIDAVTGGNYTTENYVNWLVEQLNQEMNATGGYSYLVPGEGLITYDKAVVDPLIGKDEDGKPAGSVVQVKGGTIRIANTRKAQFGGINDWNWRTVFTAGHIAADVVTAVKVTSGVIRSADNSFFIDLDNGVYRMPTGTKVGGSTIQEIAQSKAESATDALDKMLNQAKILERLSGGSQGLFVDPDTGLLYIDADYIRSGTIVTDRIMTSRNSSTYTKVGLTSWGTNGMSHYSNGVRYLDQCSLRAVDDPTNATSGVGFTTKGYGFLDASEYYKSLTLMPPGNTGGVDIDAFMKQPKTRLALQDGVSSDEKFIEARTDGFLRLEAPKLCTSLGGTNATEVGLTCTIKQPVVWDVHRFGADGIEWYYGNFELQFVNGLLVSYTIVNTPPEK